MAALSLEGNLLQDAKCFNYNVYISVFTIQQYFSLYPMIRCDYSNKSKLSGIQEFCYIHP